MNLKLLIEKLKQNLKESVKKNHAEGLLFSGGLDTSILAALSPSIIGINVSLEDYGTDIKYVKILEKLLNLKVHYLNIKMEKAIQAIPEVIKILRSFDPAIPNDITVYFGLKFAKELGLKSVMTGDGADELFAGYDYMQNIDQLNVYIRKIAKNMYFSSNEIGNFFGIEIKQPYLDRQFMNFSLWIPINLKIKKENDGIFGKWILRKAFEDVLPREIVWQSKRPLEYGSGTTKLREIISSKISDTKFEEKTKSYPVKFINKEHLYYYEIYKEVVGEIPKAQKGKHKCPGCATGLPKGVLHCKICGWTKSCITTRENVSQCQN